MDYFKINGQAYDVLVTELSENFNILYSDKTGRTIAVGAPMVLEPLGTFYGHNVTVKRKQGYEKKFDKLYDVVSTPRTVSDPETEGLEFEIAHNQTTIKYRGYVSSGSRNLKRIDERTGKVYWDELKLNIVPLVAQVKP